ncbi:MAG: FimV/HubP family polar landmark protein, partial [Arenimonas sp.]
DLAARTAEVTELKSRVSELEQQQNDRQRLIDMQNTQMKDLQDRLRAVETAPGLAASASAVPPSAAPLTIDAGSDAVAAPSSTAPAPAPAEAPAPQPVAEAPAAAPAPWYLNPYVLVGALLLILGGLVLLMRRSKPAAAENAEPSRRISDDEALRASLAKTREASSRIAPGAVAAPVIVPAGGKPAAAADGEAALKSLKDALRQRPKDLEAHLNLLRFHHARGDAEAFQQAAQDMKAQLPNTMDPRWREAVVMGASLMPKNPTFSQAGWNSPRFNDGEAAPASVPTPAPAPAPAVRTAPVTPVVPAAAAPVRVFDAPPEPQEEPGVDDPTLFGELPSQVDTHRNEAQIMVEDEASATRIELAKAYLAIGDLDGARSMLEEVLAEGGPTARSEAARILKEIG